MKLRTHTAVFIKKKKIPWKEEIDLAEDFIGNYDTIVFAARSFYRKIKFWSFDTVYMFV